MQHVTAGAHYEPSCLIIFVTLLGFIHTLLSIGLIVRTLCRNRAPVACRVVAAIRAFPSSFRGRYVVRTGEFHDKTKLEKSKLLSSALASYTHTSVDENKFRSLSDALHIVS